MGSQIPIWKYFLVHKKDASKAECHSLVDHRRWRLARADDHSIVFLLHWSSRVYTV